MPVYVYEAEKVEKSCAKCRGGFEIQQSLSEERLKVCPECSSPVIKVIQAPSLGRSQTDLHYRAKRAGFHTLKRVEKGEYEKIY
jgi:putative FmdB family regulatory protein